MDHDPAPVRLVVTHGGDPGPAALAAVAAVLTRPVVVVDRHEAEPAGPSRWQRAARLEALAPRRRIHAVTDL